MGSKLTLTVDEEVIKAAKAYAKSQGRSVSSLVENYLKSLSSEVEEPEPISAYTPITNRLRGALKVPADFDYQKTLEDALLEKYQLKDRKDES